MTTRHTLAAALLLSLAALAPLLAAAEDGPPPQPIDAKARKAVIAALGTKLQANYVFPDVATALSAQLAAKEASGGYAQARDSVAFGEALTQDLRELGKDGHFKVEFAPGFDPGPGSTVAPKVPSAEEVAAGRAEMAKHSYGIERVARLPGNVGYLEIRGFGPTELVAEAYTAAMTLLAGSDALVVDLRRNGGGEPSSVAHLMSHFFAAGDVRHLNDIYTRPTDSTQQYWTNPSVPVRYTGPVYVLTSKRTFSGGEEAAYDFQTQKRATLVGETTGGGANPGDMIAIAEGFAAFIPTGRAINPITRTNWEHVGVKPDVAVPATDAMKTAYSAILTALVAKATDLDERAALADTLARAGKGEIELPGYIPRR
ncbi:S41 family peptidase [Lysobacter koreensis]|uniref:S41 family peptidase n=1 Tax=Lysobacter koreensis TaxID=266122 RepID=A0ABW2YS73_9GAMM